jgi:EAL domain-containing protein (putative c-di-GMP-specific phosphodiesterase class I)
VIAVRVCGLREIALRCGPAHGARAVDGAATRLAASLRPGDAVLRTGDERFVVILPGLRSRSHALLAATRIVRAFEPPLDPDGTPWRGRPVMGVTFYPEQGGTADELWCHAELAVDTAERRGEQWAFYERAERPTEIAYQDLRDAIETSRLCAYFQPLWALRERRVVGVESLARWIDAEQGEIQPAQFVPLAEQSDLIAALTRWSIHTTLRHAASLSSESNLAFAINLSPRAIVMPGLVEQILDALKIWGLPPTAIVAEVTETAFVNDLSLTVRALQRLRDHGLRIAIDDFGTGYSSIAYLRRFPATDLKIDKSLIEGIVTDPRTRALVNAIVRMAHHLDLAVTAEGIEDPESLALLLDMGCDYGQGFHLGPPEAANEFVAKLEATPVHAPPCSAAD